MNNKELCDLFGTTIEDVEREVDKVERGDYSSFDFSRAAAGRPTASGGEPMTADGDADIEAYEVAVEAYRENPMSYTIDEVERMLDL